MTVLRPFRLLGKNLKPGQSVKQWDKLPRRLQTVLKSGKYVKESLNGER